MIRVFIVDDHPVVIEGIHSLLQHERDIEWAGHAMNAQSCLGFFVHNTANIILMDINLPDMNGVDLCGVIKKKYPGIFILGLSTFNQGLYIKKNSSKEDLLMAIRAVCDGCIYFSGEVGEALHQYQRSGHHALPAISRREKEVLVLIAEGYTSSEIAGKLFVSNFTVDSHRKNLIAKLNVKNTAMLI